MKTITFDETKWKLVPVEPTPAMTQAMADRIVATSRGGIMGTVAAYRAMLAATPAAPSQPLTDEEKQALVYEKLSACLQCGATSQEPVTLTDEEIKRNWSGGACPPWGIKFARAIIAALREKQAKATP